MDVELHIHPCEAYEPIGTVSEAVREEGTAVAAHRAGLAVELPDEQHVHVGPDE